MPNKENENADPFEGMVSESGKDGVTTPSADASDAGVGKGDRSDSGEAGADAEHGGVPEAGEGDSAGELAKEGESEGETQEELAKDDESEEVKEPEKPKKKLTAQERINGVLEGRRIAREQLASERGRREALEREIATLRGVKAPQEGLTEEKEPSKANEPAGKPDHAKYALGEFDSKYIVDLAAYTVREALAEARQRDAAAQQEQKDRTAVAAVVEAGRADKSLKDFDKAVKDNPLIGKEMPGAILELLLGAEPKIAAKITYHLASHPEEVRKAYGKSELAQAAYFGRLEAQYSAPAAPQQIKTPSAPPPPKDRPRGAGGQFTADDADDFEAFERKYGPKETRRN